MNQAVGNESVARERNCESRERRDWWDPYQTAAEGNEDRNQHRFESVTFGPVFLDCSDAMTSGISATLSDSSNRHFQSGTGLPRAGLLVNQCFTHLTFIRPSRDGCSFASPTCERLFRLPSSKVHANRTRCHSPCILQCRPSRRPLGRRSPSFHCFGPRLRVQDQRSISL